MKFTFATVLLFVATALCVGPDATVNIYEAEPDTAFGPTHHSIVKKGSDGKDIRTLISFTVPNTGNKCEVNFSKWAVATGSKTIALVEFVPNGGAKTFDVDKATFNSKTGFTDALLAVFVVGSPNPVYEFKCPPAGSIINFEVVSSNWVTDVEWYWWPWGWHGGFTLTAHN